MTPLTIPIPTVTGKYASDSSEAWTIYSQIHPELLAGRSVALDFDGVAVFSAVFFNVAIAQLLKDISPDTLRDCLKIEGLSCHGMELLSKCVENAKGFYGVAKLSSTPDNCSAFETYLESEDEWADVYQRLADS
jgi:hypothetical protein